MCKNRKSAALAGLLLILVALPAQGCRNCNDRESEDLIPSARRVLFKKDIFMSRGWGAAGGTAFTAQDHSGFPKKNRMLDPREEYYDRMDESVSVDRQQIPLVQFLVSPPSSYHMHNSIISRGHQVPGIFPQLFISSGWGPLGK